MKAIEKLESSDIEKAGDYCITHVPMYNSDKQTYAIVLKCPYCAMDMMSTRIHRISISRLKRFLSKLGLPFGVTVKPKLICPYNPSHSFSITNGRISAVK